MRGHTCPSGEMKDECNGGIMMNNGLAIAVVVCLLLAASAGTSEASAALARDEMAAVHGGCLIGVRN